MPLPRSGRNSDGGSYGVGCSCRRTVASWILRNLGIWYRFLIPLWRWFLERAESQGRQHCHTYRVGKPPCAEPLKHPGAVNLNGAHADPEFESDCLVRLADDQPIQHLPLTPR